MAAASSRCNLTRHAGKVVLNSCWRASIGGLTHGAWLENTSLMTLRMKSLRKSLRCPAVVSFAFSIPESRQLLLPPAKHLPYHISYPPHHPSPATAVVTFCTIRRWRLSSVSLRNRFYSHYVLSAICFTAFCVPF